MTEPPTTEEILEGESPFDDDFPDTLLNRGGMYFDKEGREINFRQWGKLFEHVAYRQVAEETVGPYWVSTVWLGLNHRFFGDAPPLIFESMVFASEPSWHEGFEFQGEKRPGYWAREDFDMRRYSTLAQALAGHAELVEEVRLFAALGPTGKSSPSSPPARRPRSRE